MGGRGSLVGAGMALLLGCQPASEPPGGPAGPHLPDLPTGGCGAPDYDWLPTADMGEILEWERVEEASLPASAYQALLELAGYAELGPVPYGTRVFRVRYRTQDRGEAVEATGLVAFPDADEPVDVPVIGWMHPTVGFSDSCAPSVGEYEILVGTTLLAAFGYAVAAPDYLGMAGWGEPSGQVHPYIVPEPTAVAALDGIRALYGFQEAGHAPSLRATATSDVVLWGASEGGFAALWADRYAAGYAPELEVRAVVASVPPTDLVGLAKAAVTDYIDATDGLLAVLATSWDWYRGDLVAPLSDALTDEPPAHVASQLLESLVADCGGGDVTDGASEVGDLLTPVLIDAFSTGDLDAVWPFGCYVEQGSLGRTAIPRGGRAPVLFQVSELDELVVGSVERASAAALCDQGYDLDYVECAGADHVDGAVQTLPLQIRWVRDRLAGVPLGETCVIAPPVDCTTLR